MVLGVMVDGADLRIVHMGKERGEIVVYSMESTTLPTRLGKLRPSEVAQPAAAVEGDDDIFGFDEAEAASPEHGFEEDTETEGGSQLEDVSASLINIFAKYPLNNTRIAVNIPEGQATYYSFESNFGLGGRKLQKRLNEEIAPLTGGTLETAVTDHFSNESGGLTVVVSEGNIPLIEEFIEIKNFLAGGTPYVCQVNSNEISLINMVRTTLDPPEDQITAVIYIGADFSRAVIMKGGDPISFIQSIREGYNSRQVCKTLFSKILLEQEESGLPEINKIVLAGEIGMTRAHEFFTKQFPDAEVHPITPGNLDTSNLKSEELAIFPNFAIPISMAWEELDKKHPKFIRTRLMPRFVKDSQKPMRVAWHGFGLLGVIFACVALLSYQGISRQGRINAASQSIKQKQEAINALQQDIAYVNQLQEQLAQGKSNLAFLEAVVLDADKWSRLFDKLTNDFKSVNNIWVDKVTSTPEGFLLVGRSLTRDRVPALAAGFPGVHLNQVSRVISEAGEQVYEFDFDAQIPPPITPEETTTLAKIADRPASTSGSISAVETVAAKLDQKVKPVAETEQTPPPVQTVTPEKVAANTVHEKQTTGAEVKPVKNQKWTEGKQSEPAAEGASDWTAKSPQSDETLPTWPFASQQSSAKSTVAKHKTPAMEKVAVSNQTEKPAASKSLASGAQDYYKRGLDYIKSDDVQNAFNEFKTVVDNYPNSRQAGSAYYWMGECTYSMKNYSEAIKWMSYSRLGEKDQAIHQFEALLKAYPEGEYTETAKRKLEKLGG